MGGGWSEIICLNFSGFFIICTENRRTVIINGGVFHGAVGIKYTFAETVLHI